MTASTKPLLALYLAYHPYFEDGAKISESLKSHFRRDLFGSVAGGTGLSVLFRSASSASGSPTLPVDPTEAETTAIVVLADRYMITDSTWQTYIESLSTQADGVGLGMRLIPVAFDREALKIAPENALRYDTWPGDTAQRMLRLTYELTFELCRMLRHYLEHLRRPADPIDELDDYLEPVRVFISHSKHDPVGEPIAKSLRRHLHDGHGLSSFFDVHDIPAGLRFERVLLRRVAQSAVVAIHTDSYSSREWCRREIIEAKRFSVPLVVANCIGDRDERGFPYLGNVPIVRMNPVRVDRIDHVVARLLDEVLKDFLWKCRVEVLGSDDPDVVFLPRPPELISLAALPSSDKVAAPLIVYPDPPLSREEERLFELVAPHVRLRSMTEWLAGAP